MRKIKIIFSEYKTLYQFGLKHPNNWNYWKFPFNNLE